MSYIPQVDRRRQRHSDVQLAALNDLFDENEHPCIQDRAVLADTLGMDIKSVNSWFANKRASSRKHSSFHDEEDEWSQPQYSWSSPPPGADPNPSHSLPPFATSVSDRLYDEDLNTTIPRRMRVRPSTWQTEELRKLYNHNSHPSREEREDLGERIGMRYQSVTNWFQNQRSLAKKRRDDDVYDALSHTIDSDYVEPQHEHRKYTAYPPASMHPSIPISASPSLTLSDHQPRNKLDGEAGPKALHVRRIGSNGPASRPRRTRPEPYQLEALKKLFARTPNPSIEERGALALEIGMDIGKVTNWFRNLRQTARKRALKANNDDGDEDAMDIESGPVSRAGSHAPQSSSTSSSVNGDSGDHDHPHSNSGSEEDEQEAVTPPPPSMKNGSRRMDVTFLTASSEDGSEPFAKNATGARLEDALLLLSFSRHLSH